MKTSENIDEICKALAAFHSEVGRISKDGTNPYLKNRYATIDQIIEEIRPILASKGLFILQAPSNNESGEIQMTTRILHESGQWIESPALTLKAQKNDPQAIGSAVTYARRYSLTSFLSLNTGEDDDGHQASTPRDTQQKQQKPKAVPKQKPQQKPQPSNGMASDAQRKKIFAVAKEKGLPESIIRNLIKYYTGKESTKELSKKAAGDVIDLMEQTKTSELYQMIGEKVIGVAGQ